LGIDGCDAFALDVPKSKHISGHMTVKGISKKRIGKECKPYYLSEDDRTRAFAPNVTMQDLSLTSIRWAIDQHHKHFKTPKQQWREPIEYLAEAKLIDTTSADGAPRITLAAVVLFGKEATLGRVIPFFDTVLATDVQTQRIRRNVVDCLKEVCVGDTSVVRVACPSVPLEPVRELVVNAYVHRCYRTQGPVVLTFRQSGIIIESPGELPGGLSAENLIYCTPIYRNLLMADGVRFFGLCDMVGKGVDITFNSMVFGGFDFPIFESGNNRFAVRISLERSEQFREFVRDRAQALSELDEVLALRLLWSRGTASLSELASVMQRGEEIARRILRAMQTKLMIQPVDDHSQTFKLAPNVLRDIETVFQRNQFRLFAEL